MGEIPLRDYVEIRVAQLEATIENQQRENLRALSVASDTLEYRLAALNELRATVQIMAENRASREDVESLRTLYEKDMKSLTKQVYILVGAMGIIQLVLAIVLTQTL